MPEKINKMPEFYMIFTRKILSYFLFWGGAVVASVPFAMEQLRQSTLKVLLVGLVLVDHWTKLVKKLAQLRHTVSRTRT